MTARTAKQARKPAPREKREPARRKASTEAGRLAEALRQDVAVVLVPRASIPAPREGTATVPAVNTSPTGNPRVFIAEDVQNLTMATSAEGMPEHGAWALTLLQEGSTAALDAAAAVLADPDALNTNVLTALGNTMSAIARRAVLRWALNACDWNLAAVSDLLRMGGSSNVLRMIRELGMGAEHAEAKRRGLVVRGQRPRELRPPSGLTRPTNG